MTLHQLSLTSVSRTVAMLDLTKPSKTLMFHGFLFYFKAITAKPLKFILNNGHTQIHKYYTFLIYLSEAQFTRNKLEPICPSVLAIKLSGHQNLSVYLYVQLLCYNMPMCDLIMYICDYRSRIVLVPKFMSDWYV